MKQLLIGLVVAVMLFVLILGAMAFMGLRAFEEADRQREQRNAEGSGVWKIEFENQEKSTCLEFLI